MFRRRWECDWCLVELRWYQWRWCSTCFRFLNHDWPSPTCSPGSRFMEEPDRTMTQIASGFFVDVWEALVDMYINVFGAKRT